MKLQLNVLRVRVRLLLPNILFYVFRVGLIELLTASLFRRTREQYRK